MTTNHLEAYGYFRDPITGGLREIPKVAPPSDPNAEAVLREKALEMAIDFQINNKEVDVAKVAAEFLAFLKGDTNV